MDCEPNLSIKQSVSSDTMVNFDGDGDGHGDGKYEQALTRKSWIRQTQLEQ